MVHEVRERTLIVIASAVLGMVFILGLLLLFYPMFIELFQIGDCITCEGEFEKVQELMNRSPFSLILLVQPR